MPETRTKAAFRIILTSILLGMAAACTPSDPQTSAISGIPEAKGWIDAAMVPPLANMNGMLVSNRGDAGN